MGYAMKGFYTSQLKSSSRHSGPIFIRKRLQDGQSNLKSQEAIGKFLMYRQFISVNYCVAQAATAHLQIWPFRWSPWYVCIIQKQIVVNIVVSYNWPYAKKEGLFYARFCSCRSIYMTAWRVAANELCDSPDIIFSSRRTSSESKTHDFLTTYFPVKINLVQKREQGSDQDQFECSYKKPFRLLLG